MKKQSLTPWEMLAILEALENRAELYKGTHTLAEQSYKDLIHKISQSDKVYVLNQAES